MSLKPKQQNIPEGWERKKLAEVVNFLDNKRVPIESDLRRARQGIYPYYGASGIIDYIDNYIFDGEFVLLGEDGANILDRSSRLAFIAKGKIWVNNHAHILEPKDSVLLYFLAEYLERINYKAYNTGSAQPKLNRAVCEKIPVIFPPLSEQNRIVAVLETWDQAIEKLKRKIEVKKEIKTGLMQDLLTCKTRLDGFNNKWKSYKLTEITSLIKDGTHATHINVNDGIPLLSAKDIVGGGIVTNNNPRLISREDFEQIHKSYRLQNGDLLLCLVGSIGRVAQVKNYKNNYTFQRSVGVLRFKNQFSDYFFQLMQARNFQNELKKKETKGAQGGVYLGVLGKIIVKVPDIEEQKAIANILTTSDKEIELLQKKFLILKDQKKYLLNNLVTGTIRTPETLSIS